LPAFFGALAEGSAFFYPLLRGVCKSASIRPFVPLLSRRFAHSPLTPFVVLTTLPNGIQRKRIASVSDPAFLLDDGECCSLEMPDLRTPADFYSVVQS
jgi:hypothetical protein